MDQLSSFQTLSVTFPSPHLAIVKLNRPKTMNAMNQLLTLELHKTFEILNLNSEVRAIILTGQDRFFSSGIDLTDFKMSESTDMGRRSLEIITFIKTMQDRVTSIENCRKPVIAVVSGYCIGLGVDVITACCIRICTKSAKFSVKEVKMGFAADMGTLQRLPKIVGNMSWVKDVAYTGRYFGAEEAERFGLVSQVFESFEEGLQAAVKLGNEIAENSPVAVIGTKVNINYSRDRTVADGLDYVVKWNSWGLQCQDVGISIGAHFQKEKPVFPKL
jgi:delta(3,5)-delta(2,4)-dienoyl-CoA isomerase